MEANLSLGDPLVRRPSPTSESKAMECMQVRQVVFPYMRPTMTQSVSLDKQPASFYSHEMHKQAPPYDTGSSASLLCDSPCPHRAATLPLAAPGIYLASSLQECRYVDIFSQSALQIGQSTASGLSRCQLFMSYTVIPGLGWQKFADLSLSIALARLDFSWAQSSITKRGKG